MAELVRTITTRGQLLTAPSRPPEVTIWRVDTWAIVAADQVMTHRGRGVWSFSFVSGGVDHFAQIDADPAASGQVTLGERYHDLAVAGVQDQVIEEFIPLMPAAVWAVDLTGFATTLVTAGDMLNAARQFATNRLDATPGNPGLLSWYQDDGTTPRFTFTLRDHTGSAVLGVAGVPALRGPATP